MIEATLYCHTRIIVAKFAFVFVTKNDKMLWCIGVNFQWYVSVLAFDTLRYCSFLNPKQLPRYEMLRRCDAFFAH